MLQETMTPRERWLAVLTHHKPDRVPMDYWGTPEATARLIRHLGLSSQSEQALVADLNLPAADANLLRDEGNRLQREMLMQLHVDFVVGVGPRYVGPPFPDGMDVFGCRFRNVNYGSGAYAECVHSPLAQFISVEEIEAAYSWPNPDWWDYSEIPAQIKGWETYPIKGGYCEPFLKYKELRGQERAFMDLALNPEIVEYCLEKLFSLAYTETSRIYEQIPGQVLLTYVAEDMGGQERLLFSPAHIRKFLLPGMRRMIDLAHQAGAFVFHHDDGNCRRILPELVEAGIDILNPIQWRCKDMDREGLKKDFGGRLVFHGGMDNQHTLPFGTVAEVEQEVLDNLSILGAGGGYILAPCHNIQVVSPPENILAMYATGYENGWLA
jgi:uroporphyrinogen decarboxylase